MLPATSLSAAGLLETRHAADGVAPTGGAASLIEVAIAEALEPAEARVSI